jgi:hypothetical protein
MWCWTWTWQPGQAITSRADLFGSLQHGGGVKFVAGSAASGAPPSVVLVEEAPEAGPDEGGAPVAVASSDHVRVRVTAVGGSVGAHVIQLCPDAAINRGGVSVNVDVVYPPGEAMQLIVFDGTARLTERSTRAVDETATALATALRLAFVDDEADLTSATVHRAALRLPEGTGVTFGDGSTAVEWASDDASAARADVLIGDRELSASFSACVRRKGVPAAVQRADAALGAAREKCASCLEEMNAAVQVVTLALIPSDATRDAVLKGRAQELEHAAVAASLAATGVAAALARGRALEAGGMDVHAQSIAASLVVRDAGAAAALGCYLGPQAAVRVVEAASAPGVAGDLVWVQPVSAAAAAAAALPAPAAAAEWVAALDVVEVPPGPAQSAVRALLGRAALVPSEDQGRALWLAARARGVDLVTSLPPHRVFYATGGTLVPRRGLVFGARSVDEALPSIAEARATERAAVAARDAGARVARWKAAVAAAAAEEEQAKKEASRGVAARLLCPRVPVCWLCSRGPRWTRVLLCVRLPAAGRCAKGVRGVCARVWRCGMQTAPCFFPVVCMAGR